MAPSNPFSSTRFEFTRDRLQHYAVDAYTCAACGHLYQPMIHSQPYLIQVGAIVIGAGLFAAFCYGWAAWIYALIPLVVGGAMLWYRSRDRRLYATGGNAKPRYGDVILKCPECGSADGAKSPGS